MRISHSSKELYNECSFKWYNHYLRKLRSKEESSALAFGDSVDAGLNHLLKTKDLTESIIKFQDSWISKKDKIIKYSKADLDLTIIEDLAHSNNPSWVSLMIKGPILITEYAEQILPRIKKVIEVQLDLSFKNESNDHLIVKTDFICEWEDGKVILFDNKTSSVKYEEDSVRKSPQLALYYEMLKEQYQIEACGYIVLPKRINKRKRPYIDIKVIIDKVDVKTIIQTLEQFDSTLVNIKNANFTKNENSCINKYGKCIYYNYCKFGREDGLEEKEK